MFIIIVLVMYIYGPLFACLNATALYMHKWNGYSDASEIGK